MVWEGGQKSLSKGNYIRKKSRGTERYSKIEIKYIQWLRQEAAIYIYIYTVFVNHTCCDMFSVTSKLSGHNQ